MKDSICAWKSIWIFSEFSTHGNLNLRVLKKRLGSKTGHGPSYQSQKNMKRTRLTWLILKIQTLLCIFGCVAGGRCSVQPISEDATAPVPRQVYCVDPQHCRNLYKTLVHGTEMRLDEKSVQCFNLKLFKLLRLPFLTAIQWIHIWILHDVCLTFGCWIWWTACQIQGMLDSFGLDVTILGCLDCSVRSLRYTVACQLRGPFSPHAHRDRK